MDPLATTGRIVYYKTRGSADGVFPPTNFAAIVTDAHNGITIDLCTFGPSGIRFETNVAKGDQPGNWDWVPFQKDQAARMAPGTINGSHPGAFTEPAAGNTTAPSAQ